MTRPPEPIRTGAGPAVESDLAVAIDCSAAEAARRLRGLPGLAVLESTLPDAQLGRYSYVAAEPRSTLAARGRWIAIAGPAGRRVVRGSPWDVLQEVLTAERRDAAPDLPPFQGGAIGYFGYDLGRHLERLPARAADDLGLPDLWIGLYDWVIAQDHQAGRTWLIAHPRPGEPPDAARRRRDRVLRRLDRPAPGPARPDPGGGPRLRSRVGRADYLAAVRRAREYIVAGDIYQVNLSHRLEGAWSGDPWAVYERLRDGAPVAYAAYLETGESTVVSASPECFLRLAAGRVETRPIKGTRPRGATPEADRALAAELAASAKDRAENLMIVDLLRNDLGRVCTVGSVRVPDLFALEGYSNVWHLVSTITGALRPDLGALDLLRACFPGGSVTGCPKIRAMEIIDELEPVRRGVYCGAIGYLDFSGALHTSIVIRTLVATASRIDLQVGGAVVADSDPDQEYAETLAKARGCLSALDAELIEW